MGGDGGTIPGRDVLVKLKRRAAVDSDPFASAAERLLYCSLTSEPLRPPFVACMLGNLYNKEALLEHLISKVDKPAFRHIRGLKDLITCDAMFDKGDGSSPPRFKCPVTGLVANGRSSFVVMRPCGCIVSLKSVTGHAAPASFERAVCPSCSKPLLSASDLAPGEPSYIPLAPSLDAADTLRKNLALARAREAHAKAEKKARKRAASSAEGRGTAATVAATVAASGPSQAADADSDAAPSKDQPSESGAGAKRARAAPDTVDAENETSGSCKPDANEAGAAGAPGP